MKTIRQLLTQDILSNRKIFKQSGLYPELDPKLVREYFNSTIFGKTNVIVLPLIIPEELKEDKKLIRNFSKRFAETNKNTEFDGKNVIFFSKNSNNRYFNDLKKLLGKKSRYIVRGTDREQNTIDLSNKIIKLIDSDKVKTELQESINDLISLRPRVTIEKTGTFSKEQFEISILENPKLNRLRREKALALRNRLFDAITIVISNIIEEEDFLDIGRPTYPEKVLDTIEALIFSEESTIKNTKEKASALLKNNLKDKNKYNYKKISVKVERNTFDIQALINAINLKLHDQIQSNMGVSSDPPIKLRYQTGRFANSAKVISGITRRDDSIRLFYTYQRNPYAVFEPGGRLHNSQRNPKAIIGKSVREVAAELFKGKVTASLSI